jgi:hypothetical protein
MYPEYEDSKYSNPARLARSDRAQLLTRPHSANPKNKTNKKTQKKTGESRELAAITVLKTVLNIYKHNSTVNPRSYQIAAKTVPKP